MVIIENVCTYGWKPAIMGMRNPMNSWEKSDSDFGEVNDKSYELTLLQKTAVLAEGILAPEIGPNDWSLMKRLAAGGPVHAKYRRMIVVYADITAPLYWWKEFDTYKVGTVANSCSTMHTIANEEFTLDDFSHEHLIDDPFWVNDDWAHGLYSLKMTIETLNGYRKMYLETKNKKYWWQMIQLLPSSYNQMRTVMMNYEVLAGLYSSRKDHKLDEWRQFCEWIEMLPYSEIITGPNKNEEDN